MNWKTFWDGFLSINLFGNYKIEKPEDFYDGLEKDREASDWKKVGDDFRNEFNEIEKEIRNFLELFGK